MTHNKPNKIQLHKKSKRLELVFDQHTYQLSAEYLRTHSPSAEVRGHGVGQAVLVHGKIAVGITDLKATGNYGLQIIFDDQHDSGIFSWDYLLKLAENHTLNWQHYLDRLSEQQQSRDPNTSVVQFL